MSALWWTILATGVACYLTKLAGLSVPQRLLEHPLTVRIATLIPVALLGALVAVQTFGVEGGAGLDARVPAIVVAAGLLAVRAPFLIVVFGAAAVAAGLRLLA